MAIASTIRFYRKRAGITQIELAEKLNISIATLRRWEAGETAPNGTRIKELAEVFNVMPEDIVTESTNEKNSEGYSGRAEKNNGMLIFEGDGTKIELPPTEKGYELFNKLIDNLINKHKN